MSGAELPLAIVGIILASPAIISAIQQLRGVLTQRIKSISSEPGLYESLASINQSQTFEVVAFMAQLEPQLSEELRSELRTLLGQLRLIYEELAAELSKPFGPSISPRRRERIKAIFVKIEEWNDRYMKRAIVFLFFGQASSQLANSSDEIERIIRSSKVLEKVQRLRTAVQTAFSSPDPPGRLLLDSTEIPDVRTKLPDSDLLLGTKGTETSLVEYRIYPEDTDRSVIQSTRKTTQSIASLLRKADSETMGILSCRGFFWDSLQYRVELHFPFPTGGFENPRSLLELLNDSADNPVNGRHHSLNDRLNLAKRIATGIFYVHSGDFVHKNIRSSNIIIFKPTRDLPAQEKRYRQYPRVIGQPFLVGYDGVRKFDAASLLQRVEDWQKNLYLSPARHRLQPGDEFTPKHDVYSLGVVLLEIALWRTFTSRRGLGKVLWDGDRLKAPETIRSELLNLARRNVPQVMGRAYTETVIACLEELKEEEERGELADEDLVIPAPAYITAIMKRLEEICV